VHFLGQDAHWGLLIIGHFHPRRPVRYDALKNNEHITAWFRVDVSNGFIRVVFFASSSFAPSEASSV
jgi:hypothetical protein